MHELLKHSKLDLSQSLRTQSGVSVVIDFHRTMSDANQEGRVYGLFAYSNFEPDFHDWTAEGSTKWADKSQHDLIYDDVNTSSPIHVIEERRRSTERGLRTLCVSVAEYNGLCWRYRLARAQAQGVPTLPMIRERFSVRSETIKIPPPIVVPETSTTATLVISETRNIDL